MTMRLCFCLLQYLLFYLLPIKLVCLELEALTFFNVMQTQTLLSDQTFHIIFPCPIFGQSMRLETIFVIYKSNVYSTVFSTIRLTPLMIKS